MLQHIRTGMDQETRRIEAEDKKLHAEMKMEHPEGEENVPGNIFMADNITLPGGSETSQQILAATNKPSDNGSFKTILGVSALALSLGIPASLLGGAMLLREKTTQPIPQVQDTDTDTTRGIRILR